jgi:acyl transferase domain-containing protein
MSGERSVTKQALLALEQMRERLKAAEQAGREPIAVIGLGLRFPGAPDPDAFWDLLQHGVDATSDIPADRWDVDAFFDPDPNAIGKIYARRGGFVPDIDAFDAEFFGVSPREARSMDPQHRLLLEVTWEAIEHAGLAASALAGSRTGVFVGITVTDYAQLMAASGNAQLLDHFAHHGNVLNAAAGRLSYTLGLHGPSLAIDTACSSSLVAAHLACQSLRSRDCEMAIVGGVNLILSPSSSIRLARGHMLAPDGRCKTFAAAADGYARGEGCGVLVLKRLSAAVADGDRVLAVVRGSSVNQDGRTSGLTVPNGLAQRMVIRDALKNAGLEPQDVSYIEAHGTGTELGDPIEMDALADVLGAGRTEPLRVGSVKTNIGHLESASGVAGLIKVVLALHQDAIPAHLNFQTPSPHIDWPALAVKIPTALEAWPAGARRVAGVSSFGASGTNAHMLLEQAPAAAAPTVADGEGPYVLPLSAETDVALRQLGERYTQLFDRHPELTAAEVCRTAAIGRSHFTNRAAVLGRTVADLRAGVEALSRGGNSPAVLRGTAPRDQTRRVAFLFTGQGSQYPRMSAELFETDPLFRAALETCSRAFAPHLDVPLLDLLYQADADPTRLDRTGYTQPALFAVEYALARMLAGWGIEPRAVIGHSVGEFAAACVAGILSVEDAAMLVAARGRFMQALPEGGAMVAVTLSEDQVRGALAPYEDRVAIAAINAADQLVLSGDRASLDRLLDSLDVAPPDRRWLQVSHAFHSPLMAPMLDAFARVAAGIAHAAPAIPFASNVTGGFLTTAPDAGYWTRHARTTVRFAEGMAAAAAAGCSMFVEIGPTPTLLALAQRTLNSADYAWSPTLRRGRSDNDQKAALLGSLYVAGAQVDWQAVNGDRPKCRIALPTYPFARDRYWFEPREATVARKSAAGTVVTPSMATPLTVANAYDLTWKRTSAPGRSSTTPGVCVVLSRGDGPGEALVQAMARQGRPCVEVRLGAAFERESSTAYAVRPAVRADLELALRAVRDELGAIDVVIHAWGAGHSHGDPSLAWIREYLALACGSLVNVVQVLSQTPRPPRLFVFTAGATREAPAFYQGSLWGVARTVAREHPELRCTIVDVDSSVDAHVGDALLTEVDAEMRDDQVSFHNGERHVARLSAANVPAGHTPISDAATYIVTGGLGGAGFAVVEWLSSRGAKHVALFNRRSPTVEMAAKIAALEARYGAQVRPVQVDIADATRLSAVVDEIGRAWPPVRGIVHAAGVLADRVLSDLDWPLFEQPLVPKAYGAWNLHEAASGLSLDFFVLFSSFTATVGSAGQANYAAANAFVDALAQYRRSRGLPATSIAWGPWKVGMLASLDDAHRERWNRQGLRPFDPVDACAALDAAAASGRASLALIDIDWRQFLAANRREGEAYFEAVAVREPSAPERVGNLLDEIAAAPATRRRATVLEALEEQARFVLGAADGKRVDVNRPLRELGLDSLMAVELRNTIAARIGQPLPATLLFDYPTIANVTDFVLRTFVAPSATVTSEAVDKAQPDDIDAIEALSADEAEDLLAAELEALDD